MTIYETAEVVLPVAIRHSLTYRIPEEWRAGLRPGHRVRVNLRGRETHGYVVSCSSAPPKATGRSLSPVLDVVPDEPILDEAILSLALWVAEYYAAPIGEVLEAALPAQVWKGPPLRAKPPDFPGTPGEPPQLTEHQSGALASLLAAAEREDAGTAPVFLLHGVPGSGKTEVYVRLAHRLLERGRGTLVLVPEIAMGTQVVQRFAERLGDAVGFFHSGMPAGQRRATWWRAREGKIRVVVGTRSAVFVPLRDLGAVVVDEEHEAAYKQSESPRYNGRDVALLRARREGAVALLGSATPSMESRRNVDVGKYRLLLMPDRVEKRPHARVVLVDLRPAADGDGAPEAAAPGDDPEVIRQPRAPQQALSPFLVQRVRSCVERGEQSILFLNRRGLATSVQCQDCGHVFRCPNCSVILTFHRDGAVLRCHYCDHRQRGLSACVDCGSEYLLYGGFGTQRIEAELGRLFPGARVLRMDMDTTRRSGAHREMIRQFADGEFDILVGTQMVGKGLDFPGVTLVGALLADREMAIPDFRAQERAFQILTQVAGRAGRGSRRGEVVFQTFMPEHFVIRSAARRDYDAFFETESLERKALGFPPFARLVNLLLDDPKEDRVGRRARSLATHLGETMRGRAVRGVRVLGPAPMILERLKGRYRWHLTLRGPTAGSLKPWVDESLRWNQSHRSTVRLMIDVDPLHAF